MTTIVARQAAVSLLLLIGVSSCTHTLPRADWNHADDITRWIAARDAQIQSFTITGRMRLLSEGQNVELTTVIVALPPDHMRIRAWKFSHAVLDITLNADGLFVWFNESQGSPNGTTDKLSHANLLEALTLLPGFGATDAWSVEVDGKRNPKLLRRNVRGQSGRLLCILDGQTLTRTQCDYLKNDGRSQQTLRFERYRQIGAIPWPMKIVGDGAGGSFVLNIDDVDLNSDHPPKAFTPPRRATRQP